MRTFTSIVSDLTPGQLECVKQEFRIDRVGFEDRAKAVAPILDDEAVGIIRDELVAEAEARGE